MGRPLNKHIFGDNANNNIKVHFHNGTAGVQGFIIRQRSNLKFLCQDASGNQAVCKLVNKARADLNIGEMSIAVIYDDGTTRHVQKIAKNLITVDYSGVNYVTGQNHATDIFGQAGWSFSNSTSDTRWQIDEAGTDTSMTGSTDVASEDGYSWTPPSGWAGYEIFNGTNQRLSVAASSDFAAGTGPFTIEFVTNFQAGGGSFPRVFSLGTYPTATVACSIEGGATPTIYFWINGSIAAQVNTSGPLFTGMPSFVNNFHHVVLQRNSSGYCNIYIDGNLVTNNVTANTYNLNNSSTPLAIAVEPQGGSTYANWMKGYLTNFRWTNSAVYPDRSFPVMSTALTALAQTKLLLLMASNGALNTDSSASPKTVTPTGTPTWHVA